MRLLSLAALIAIGCVCGCGGNVGNGPGGGGNAGNGGGGAGGSGGSSLGATIDATEPAMHCLQTINMYRAQNGAPAAQLDDQLSTFSMQASQALAAGGSPHGYFASAGSSIWQDGFCGSVAENQAPGWPINNGDEDGTIDAILAQMMAEGPGGGHHDNIVNPANVRIGVGLVVDGSQKLWFTNDFSAACP